MVKKELKVRWDEEAKTSLRSIYTYIKKRESVNAAKKVRDKIVSETRSLPIFPEKFIEEPMLKEEPGNYHSKVVYSYKIIYEVTEEAIYILDVFHISRNPSEIKSYKIR